MISLFLIGLSGGFSHCIAMCHPFVLLISALKPAEAGYRILLPQIQYNLGRIVTYAFLGFIIGQINLLPYRKTLTILAGVLLIIIAIFTVAGKHIRLPGVTLFSNIKAVKSPLVMGLMLGFLPCGLVLSALVAASAEGTALMSAFSMAAFGLGTSAALLLLALFGGVLLKYMPVAKWIFLAVILYKGVQFIYKGLFIL